MVGRLEVVGARGRRWGVGGRQAAGGSGGGAYRGVFWGLTRP
jgi:hypothetical protein